MKICWNKEDHYEFNITDVQLFSVCWRQNYRVYPIALLTEPTARSFTRSPRVFDTFTCDLSFRLCSLLLVTCMSDQLRALRLRGQCRQVCAVPSSTARCGLVSRSYLLSRFLISRPSLVLFSPFSFAFVSLVHTETGKFKLLMIVLSKVDIQLVVYWSL